VITDSSWDFTSLWGSSSFSLSLSAPASRVTVDVVDIVFKGVSIPGCGESMLTFGEESFAANVEDPKIADELIPQLRSRLLDDFLTMFTLLQEILPTDCVVFEIPSSATEVSRACG
jgi:hypothetical protein